MNSSVCSADRSTHLRIVIAALIASIGMVIFALAVHVEPEARYDAVVRIHPSQNAALSDPATSLTPAHRI